MGAVDFTLGNCGGGCNWEYQPGKQVSVVLVERARPRKGMSLVSLTSGSQYLCAGKVQRSNSEETMGSTRVLSKW